MSELFNINLHYLFVHMLVHNKHLLFNMRSMVIKVIIILQMRTEILMLLEAAGYFETSVPFYEITQRYM